MEQSKLLWPPTPQLCTCIPDSTSYLQEFCVHANHQPMQGKGKGKGKEGTDMPYLVGPPNLTHTGIDGAGLTASCSSRWKSDDQGAVYASGRTPAGISWSV